MKKTVVINYNDETSKTLNFEASDEKHLFEQIDKYVLPKLDSIIGVSILPYINKRG